jgi:GT2 family glycosyltransferase
MNPLVHIIIVTHNSSREIPLCLQAIENQNHRVDTITIVDSGSDSTAYLSSMSPKGYKVILRDNVGFGIANNIGYQSLKPGADDIIVFLNPDAFLHDEAISEIVKTFDQYEGVGCVTGKLHGYSLSEKKRTGLLDSTGIFRKWYGRWYDRGQGALDTGLYERIEAIPAVCGALMCCRAKALEIFNGEIFDSSFFLYKEDIELSLKIRRNGWRLFYSPHIVADHCRGWSEDRATVSYRSRLVSAENEVKLYCRHPSPYMAWAIAKYIAVRLLRI